MDLRVLTLQIRKNRKKLRQIENLESLDRDLNDEEINKVLLKDGLRGELYFLLEQYKEEESKNPQVEEDFNSSCSVSTDWSLSVSESDVNVKVIPDNINDNLTLNANTDEAREQMSEVKESVTQKTELNQKKEPANSQRGASQINTQSPNPISIQSSLTKKGKAVKSSNTNPRNSKTVFWDTSGFTISSVPGEENSGHNDLTTAVDCKDHLFVSASRDTTVKLWDLKTLAERRSFGSHTGSVTDVVLLSVKELGSLGQKLGLTEDDYLILSGSVDCSLKLWSANTGELLKSIYTYNPITKVVFHPELLCAVTASDGGKLELWDLDTKDNIASTKAHDDAVTGLEVKNGKIFTSSAVDGEIKIFEIRDNNLVTVFASENVHLSDGKSVYLRHIKSLNVKGDNLYFGDDGVNLKILEWKKGLVRKVPNHKDDFGMTDAICINGDTMITSAFDLDNGTGYLNVFDIADDPLYLATMYTEEAGRILDIACCHSDGKFVTIVTAGTMLQVWRQLPKSSANKDLIQTKFEPTLSHPAVDSDLESDVEFSESDGEPDPAYVRRDSDKPSTWMSWCNVL